MIDDMKECNENLIGIDKYTTQEEIAIYLKQVYNRCLEDLERLEKEIKADYQQFNDIGQVEEDNIKKYKAIKTNKKKLLKRIEESRENLNRVKDMIKKL
ncbi:hypothetical protein [Clostridium manihotivorum]|uniref:Uncharacterized protein n=1 Tax=Clostridium manihotivorum TaxID=2320868 RepID=A0A410DMC4_9CLOT|nr:hypothetical protein [Clostridium manihotivorum]QAA30228.1 hypothetical protein C1I91_00145 [Clostridium manihotivorum]